MHLVQEQDRLSAVQCLIVLSSLNNLPYILHGSFHRIQTYELSLRVMRNNMRECRLAASRGAIEQNRRDLIRLNRSSQQLPPTYDMLLTNIFIKILRSHPVRKQPSAPGVLS